MESYSSIGSTYALGSNAPISPPNASGWPAVVVKGNLVVIKSVVSESCFRPSLRRSDRSLGDPTENNSTYPEKSPSPLPFCISAIASAAS